MEKIIENISKCEHEQYLCKICNNNMTIFNEWKKEYSKKKKYCEHNIYKRSCIDCNRENLCIHKSLKHKCCECKICKHNITKKYCVDCNYDNLCIHNNLKKRCKYCRLCEHNKMKSLCDLCNVSNICCHNNILFLCNKCSKSEICIHYKNKYYCRICDGSKLCKSEWCTNDRNIKYNNYCLPCCVHLFPDLDVVKKYKIKETDVISHIKTAFPNFSWKSNIKIEGGCSQRRPDLFLDLLTHVIIIEIDEHRHQSYDTLCENKRIMQLSEDVAHRPIIFIRFNPDEYIDNSGNLISSCWKMNKILNILQLDSTKKKEWQHRIKCLIDEIQKCINYSCDKTIDIKYLFY